jgi:cardiolipin synthase
LSLQFGADIFGNMKSQLQRHPKLRECTRHNRVKLVRGGTAYFDCLVGMIEAARETIHLQTYIFDDDETGRLVGNALKAAAKRKVAVYVLADGFASRRLSDHFINDLRNAGVKFRFFEPLFKSRYFYFGRRLHHKLLVTDTRFALTGGVNISDRYNDKPGHAAWLDFALFVEGEAAKELCVLCWKTWNGYPQGMGITPCEQKQALASGMLEDECLVSMRRNDWVRRKNEISSAYVSMFLNAQSHITILCSYFLPGRVIRRQIAAAAKRGVRITIITAGISDVSIAKYAERYMYKWLLRQEVEIYEYRLNVLHGKVAVCDDQWLTIGSYNINNLSAYALPGKQKIS